MNLKPLQAILAIFSCTLLQASPGTITPYIKIDQFGYLPVKKWR